MCLHAGGRPQTAVRRPTARTATGGKDQVRTVLCIAPPFLTLHAEAATTRQELNRELASPERT